MLDTIRISTIKIQENRDAPRIWLEGKYLSKAGFAKNSKFKVIFFSGKITLFLAKDGDHRVSERRKSPVIDINTKKIHRTFHAAEMAKVIVKLGRIILTKSKMAIRKASAIKNGTCGSFFSGGGPFDLAAKIAKCKTLFAIEKEQAYADVWQRNHSGTMLNLSIEQVEFDKLPKVEVFIAGIPCEPFSKARKNADSCSQEDHPNYDLSIFLLFAVEAINPRTIILEEVPAYVKSGIGKATIAALKRSGYNVHIKDFTGPDYGELETRPRTVIVATYNDKFEFPKVRHTKHTMKEILLPASHPDCKWFTQKTKPWVFSGWKKQKKKGNKFQSQIVMSKSDHINTIPKRYWAQQYGNPIIKHDTQEKYRWLSISEGKKLFGLPKSYTLHDSQTISGEIIGQSVLVRVFAKIIERAIA